MRGGILDRVAGLVGEFAKIDLMGVAGAGQHADIGPGAEHPFLARTHNHDLHLRVLETQPLDRISQLNIDAKIIGIKFQLIAVKQSARLINIQGQRCGVTVRGKPPVPITVRIGLEIDDHEWSDASVNWRTNIPGQSSHTSIKMHLYANTSISMHFIANTFWPHNGKPRYAAARRKSLACCSASIPAF